MSSRRFHVLFTGCIRLEKGRDYKALRAVQKKGPNEKASRDGKEGRLFWVRQRLEGQNGLGPLKKVVAMILSQLLQSPQLYNEHLRDPAPWHPGRDHAT